MDENYTWPVLSRKDIAACLSELHIPITEHDLSQPQPDKVRMIYQVLVEFLMGKTQEDFQNTDPKSLEAFNYPELHLEAIGWCDTTDAAR